jgi:hypothetical protein
MKNSIIVFSLALLIVGHTAWGQKPTTTDTTKHGNNVEISNDGVFIGATKKVQQSRKQGTFSLRYAAFELGANRLADNTNYANAGVQSYLHVPDNMKNSSLFNIHYIGSINVNIYPVGVKYLALKKARQVIYLSSALGLQFYNFMYKEPLQYTRNPSAIALSPTSFKKDKLGLDYLNIPLMITFKTKLDKDTWLTYGAGITGGYLLSAWNKQKTNGGDKSKIHDRTNFQDFNSCVTGELGIEGIIRVYASYQMTSLYSNGLNQHPICIGLRFGGA